MKLVSLSCKKCSAPLEVPEGVRLATCVHCGTRLEIQSHGESIDTAVLDELRRSIGSVEQQVRTVQRVASELQRKSDQLERRNRALRLQVEIKNLKAWWQRVRKSWLRDGAEPSLLSAFARVFFRFVFLFLLIGFSVGLMARSPSIRNWVVAAASVCLVIVSLSFAFEIYRAVKFRGVKRMYQNRLSWLNQQYKACGTTSP